MTMRPALTSLLIISLASSAVGGAADLTQDEIRAFARGMCEYITAHHVKPTGPQTGMVYEYYRPLDGRWITLEGQDVMHDGAWFADALVQAYRATGDDAFVRPLREKIMPFYHHVLLDSEKLFGQPRGFCPFWWDDGASLLYNEGKPAVGWSKAHLSERGGFNHMKQDLAVMLMSYWLLTRDPRTAEAAAAVDDDGRARWGMIPDVAVAAGVSNRQPERYKDILPFKFDPDRPKGNEYYRAFYKGEKTILAPFLDDAGFYYSIALAQDGRIKVDEEFAARFLFFVYSALRANDLWWDDAPAPAGINQWEGGDRWIENGRFQFTHSQRPEYPQGSRLGTQLIWGSALGLQLLDAFPNSLALCQERMKREPIRPDVKLDLSTAAVRARLQREVKEGLKYWHGVFKARGYIPPFISGRLPWKPPKGAGLSEDWIMHVSESGGAAHLIAACAQALNLANGKRDWELAWSIPADAPK